MYAQIFLGIAMIVIGTGHLLNKRKFLKRNIESTVSDVRSFQRGLILPYFLLGILFIVMGIVEKKEIFETSAFIGIYIILSIIPLTIAAFNNKKHTGHYWFW